MQRGPAAHAGSRGEEARGGLEAERAVAGGHSQRDAHRSHVQLVRAMPQHGMAKFRVPDWNGGPDWFRYDIVVFMMLSCMLTHAHAHWLRVAHSPYATLFWLKRAHTHVPARHVWMHTRTHICRCCSRLRWRSWWQHARCAFVIGQLHHCNRPLTAAPVAERSAPHSDDRALGR